MGGVVFSFDDFPKCRTIPLIVWSSFSKNYASDLCSTDEISGWILNFVFKKRVSSLKFPDVKQTQFDSFVLLNSLKEYLKYLILRLKSWFFISENLFSRTKIMNFQEVLQVPKSCFSCFVWSVIKTFRREMREVFVVIWVNCPFFFKVLPSVFW